MNPAQNSDHFIAWRAALADSLLTRGGARLAAWLRSAPLMHTAPIAAFHCPLCSHPCAGWGTHLTRDCALAVGCVFYGFRALASRLADSGLSVTWQSPSSFTADTSPWHLVPDQSAAARCSPASPSTTHVFWSGLISSPHHDGPHAPGNVLIAVYLNAAADWLTLPLPQRRW